MFLNWGNVVCSQKAGNNWTEGAVLKEAPRLRIRTRWDDKCVHVRYFVEARENKFLDDTVNSGGYSIFHDGVLIYLK